MARYELTRFHRVAGASRVACKQENAMWRAGVTTGAVEYLPLGQIGHAPLAKSFVFHRRKK